MTTGRRRARRPLDPPVLTRWALVATAIGYVAAVILLPMVVVFSEALSKGLGTWWAALREPDAIASIRLTLLVALITVPANCVFGLVASWAVAKHDFRGRDALVTLIDVPFSVSPVVSGLVFVLLFGAQGWFRRLARRARRPHRLRHSRHRHRDDVRDLPLRRARTDPADAGAGRDEEEAALSLGAGGSRPSGTSRCPTCAGRCSTACC